MSTILTRWQAMKMAWHLLRFATGTNKIQIVIKLNGEIEIQGAGFIDDQRER